MTPQARALLRLLYVQDVTPLDAWQDLGIYRVGARIFELRQLGYPITTTIVRRGGARVARYRLAIEERDARWWSYRDPARSVAPLP